MCNISLKSIGLKSGLKVGSYDFPTFIALCFLKKSDLCTRLGYTNNNPQLILLFLSTL